MQKLSDVLVLHYGKALKKEDRRDGPFPVFGSSGVVGSHNASLSKGPGVIVGRKGNVGSVYWSESDFFVIDTAYYVTTSIHLRFLYYLLPTLNFINGDAAVPGLSRNQAYSLHVSIPPFAIQQRIAGILSAYDELIENIQQRIKILESMARVLYREWFVYFRFPGHETVPLVPSVLGELPQGWEVKPLIDLCDRIESGGTPRRSNSEYWENGDIDWYKTGELWDRFLFNSQEQITPRGQIESSARLFEEGTILMAIYGSPTVGRMGLLTRRASCNQAALGLVANHSLISQTYLYFVLYSLRGHFNSLAQGAAQQNISKEKVTSALAVLPPRQMIKSFDAVSEPVFAQLKILQSQVQNLRASRDLLLPRLLSGQLDVEAKTS